MESAASAGSASDEEWVVSAKDSAEDSSSVANTISKKSRSVSEDRPYSVRGPVTENQPSTIAPPLEQKEFDSWEELESYMKKYLQDTYQSYRVRTNNKVSQRNNRIVATKPKQPKVPDAWVYYGKTFVCTHAGKYKSRGQGKRKRQQSRMVECDAQVRSL